MSEFIENVAKAADEMRDLFDATPLQENTYLSSLYDAKIMLKREDLSPVRSYKIRGAFNFFRKHLENASKSLECFVGPLFRTWWSRLRGLWNA